MAQSCPLQFSGNSSEQGGAELDQAQVELEALKWKKIFQWSPLWIIFKGKIKIAHLLPQQSVHRDDHFLQT